MIGIRELRKTMVRGQRVRIRHTAKDESLRGKSYFIKSEGLVKCRGGDRCAGDRKCNGYALFVTRKKPVEGDGAGWRKGAHLLCCTHLTTTDGTDLTKERKARTAKPKSKAEKPKPKSKRKPRTRKDKTEQRPVVSITLNREEVEAFTREIEDANSPVTWVELAEAAKGAEAGDPDAVIRLVEMARRLKVYTTNMSARLIEVQDSMINIQRLALEEIATPIVPEETVEETSTEGEEVVTSEDEAVAATVPVTVPADLGFGEVV